MGKTVLEDNPFGPLSFINQYIITHAQPITSSNWPVAIILPIIPLGLQAYLLQSPGTRTYRIAIGIVGLGTMLRAWGSYRYAEPQLNAFNNGLSIAFLHLSVKYIEFALLQHPIIDPYLSKGRSRIISAMDLCINSRMVGLGSIELDQVLEPVKSLDQEINGSVKTRNLSSNNPSHPIDGSISTSSTTIPSKPQRHLPAPNKPRTYTQAMIRHITHMIFHYLILDTLLSLLRNFGSGTVANPLGYRNSIPTFIMQNRFIALPHLRGLSFIVPDWLVWLMIELGVGGGVWQGLNLGYHALASVAVGTGLWEVESWEVDLFDQPWKADSLLDLWGRRWHQLFRHHFLLISTAILKTLNLPITPPFIMPLIFLLSGTLHAIGEISMSPVPSPRHLILFFFLSGIGCASEVIFKRISGKRVEGWSGRVWAWAWMLIFARLAVGAWLDGGIGGSLLTGEAGPGDFLANLIKDWLVDTA